MSKKLIPYALLTAVLTAGLTPALPIGTAIAQSAASKSGSFSGAGRKTGQGSVTLVRNADGTGTLTFRNFRVSKGPDLRIWLSNANNVKKSRDVKRGKYIEISKLKSSRGNQSYTISKAALDSGYDTVAIWCKPFGVLFAKAELN